MAAVRGTELALVVDDAGALEAGVIEGEVAFEPPKDKEARETWSEKEVLVSSSTGFVVKPEQSPEKTSSYPPLVVSSLDWFDHVRDRVKKIQVEWKDIDPLTQKKIRTKALSELIDWEIPKKIDLERPGPKKHSIPPPR